MNLRRIKVMKIDGSRVNEITLTQAVNEISEGGTLNEFAAWDELTGGKHEVKVKSTRYVYQNHPLN